MTNSRDVGGGGGAMVNTIKPSSRAWKWVNKRI